MSNDSFRKIADTVVSASTVANPLKANNIASNFLSSSLVNATLANVSLTANSGLLKIARDQALLVKFDAASAPRSLTLGADTATNARNLQSVLALKQLGDQVVLRFINNSSALPAFALSLANTSAGPATFTNVQVTLRGGAPAATQILFVAAAPIGIAVTPSGVAYVVATALNVTSGSEVIQFDIKLPVTPFA